MEATKIFKNRTEAGKELAEKLLEYKGKNTVVFALPRGGVPIGFEIAKKLGCPLDTVVARKLGIPGNPEMGMGAIAPGDIIMLNQDLIAELGLKDEQVNEILSKEREEMERRMEHYESGEFLPNINIDIAILADDGLATGITALAAIESVKLIYKPSAIIFAAPVCSKNISPVIQLKASKFVCIYPASDMFAVGQFYQDFEQVTDDEVVRLLNSKT